jgi:hypothetical protein
MNNTVQLLARNKPKVPAQESPCLVCGQSTNGGWFVRAQKEGAKLYLCSPYCALSFFASHDPPAHDHAARHEYYRVRKAVVKAALSITGLQPGHNTQLDQTAL